MTPYEKACKKVARGFFKGVVFSAIVGVFPFLISWLKIDLDFILDWEVAMDASPGIAILCFIITCAIAISRAVKNGHIYCKNCGERLLGDDIVDASFVSSSTSSESAKATIRITTCCASCGNTQSFEKAFTIAERKYGGSVTEYDIEDIVYKYFY